MKIELHNFGPIHYYEFDLDKDLHLIYGENNVGKSYAISAVYLILKGLNDVILNEDDNPFIDKYNSSKRDIELKRINGDLEKSFKERPTNVKFDFKNQVENIIDFFLNQTLAKSLLRYFRNNFSLISNLQNQKTNQNSEILLKNKSYIIKIKITQTAINIKFQFQNKKNKIGASYGGDSELLPYKLSLNDEVILASKHINVYNISICDYFLKNELIDDSKGENNYFLPASRSALYIALNSLTPIIVELSQYRNGVENRLTLPSLSQTISDYYLQLSRSEITDLGDTFSNYTKVLPLVQKLESEFLNNGKIFIDGVSRKILYQPEGTDLMLNLSEISSMIAEIIPIIIFLKHIIFKPQEDKIYNGGVLFIEEPEAHLHPKIQVKLMEIFAELSQHGVKVVMTTHSNYMFNKLGNLLLEGKISPDKVSSCLMKMTKKGSVADYEVMKAEADGINDENFADVAEQLYNERLELYDKLNQKANAH